MAWWLLFSLLLWSILGESRGQWLRSKPAPVKELLGDGNSDQFQGSCAERIHKSMCWCGEGPHRRQTIVNVKYCPYSTAWGSECEPCTPPKELCRRLERCARCHQHNPNVICADCPPDRHGLRCEKERPCKTPNITEHMTVHPYATRKGIYKLEFRCTGGRVRDGPKAIRCLKNSKKWSKDPPKCVLPMRCSSLPTDPIPFTRLKEDNYGSERAVYECDAGYVASGKVLETALLCENGIWVQRGESVQCEPIPKCTSLPSYLGARLMDDTPIKSVYDVGETVQYECEESFRPRDNNTTNFTLVCSGQQWHGQAPDCELKGCKDLTVQHGDVAYSADLNSSQAGYLPLYTTAWATCQKGYKLQNPQNVTCSRSGQWLPSDPKCVPKTCEDMERGKMCSVNPASFTVIPDTNKTEIYPGETVKFKCRKNFFRKLGVGQTERICIHNGTLSGSEIQCSPVQTCKIILPPEDRHLRYCRGRACVEQGKDVLEQRIYELPSDVIPWFGHVEFSCDSKYHCVDGNYSLQCLPQHRSKLAAPRCKPVCGIRNFAKVARVMGGKLSGIEAWPWQAVLWEVRWKQVQFLCGATLIDDAWAVTAAHCVTIEKTTKVQDAKSMRLTYGLNSTKESAILAVNHSETRYNVARIIIHPEYNGHSLDNDIALLELETPAEIGYHVGVACLPTGDRQLVGGEEGMVTGWGRTETEDLPQSLRELPLTVVNSSHCKKHYEDQGYNGVVITAGMFCAMSNSSIEDTTNGDSGGPFVVQDGDGHWVLEGIVSWGGQENHQQDPEVNRRAHVQLSKGPSLLPTCPGSACYGGYTRVANYIRWIRQQTNGRIGAHRCRNTPIQKPL